MTETKSLNPKPKPMTQNTRLRTVAMAWQQQDLEYMEFHLTGF